MAQGPDEFTNSEFYKNHYGTASNKAMDHMHARNHLIEKDLYMSGHYTPKKNPDEVDYDDYDNPKTIRRNIDDEDESDRERDNPPEER